MSENLGEFFDSHCMLLSIMSAALVCHCVLRWSRYVSALELGHLNVTWPSTGTDPVTRFHLWRHLWHSDWCCIGACCLRNAGNRKNSKQKQITVSLSVYVLNKTGSVGVTQWVKGWPDDPVPMQTSSFTYSQFSNLFHFSRASYRKHFIIVFHFGHILSSRRCYICRGGFDPESNFLTLWWSPKISCQGCVTATPYFGCSVV